MAKKPGPPVSSLRAPGLPEHRRNPRDVIYEAMARGGESFGAPFRQGLASLTEQVVQRFKQRSFFGFETLDRGADAAPGNGGEGEAPTRNKFTRYGAAPFRGPYKKPPR